MIRNLFYTVRRRLVRMDVMMLFCVLLLLLIGLQTIYSTGQEAGGSFARHWLRQTAWAGVGMFLFLGVASCDYRWLGRISWLFYFIGLGLLVLVLFFGLTVNHSKSWLPLLGVTVQPAELAKPATLLIFAWVASRPGLRPSSFFPLLPLGAVFGLPVFLIFLQPDWGTALVFAGMVLPILFLGGLPWRMILMVILALALTTPLAYKYVLKQHQRDRIQTFVNPSRDISDTGWNAHQSILAVGSGGLTGKGFMKGTQHVLGFLPRAVAPTDFVFSVIGEENGFLGSAAVVAAFLALIGCCLRTAWRAVDEFGAYLALGVAGLIFTHAYINIGMNIQAAPIIGIPLPLVSYGGSFLLCCLISLGLVQAVHIQYRLAADRTRETLLAPT